MKKDRVDHVFKETKVMTSIGDYAYVYLCENCGVSEFNKESCTYGVITSPVDYIEKALKAVASA
jgi:hypothetical protein